MSEMFMLNHRYTVEILSVACHLIFFSICFVCLVLIFTTSQRLQGIVSEAETLVLATHPTHPYPFLLVLS